MPSGDEPFDPKATEILGQHRGAEPFSPTPTEVVGRGTGFSGEATVALDREGAPGLFLEPTDPERRLDGEAAPDPLAPAPTELLPGHALGGLRGGPGMQELGASKYLSTSPSADPLAQDPLSETEPDAPTLRRGAGLDVEESPPPASGPAPGDTEAREGPGLVTPLPASGPQPPASRGGRGRPVVALLALLALLVVGSGVFVVWFFVVRPDPGAATSPADVVVEVAPPPADETPSPAPAAAGDEEAVDDEEDEPDPTPGRKRRAPRRKKAGRRAAAPTPAPAPAPAAERPAPASAATARLVLGEFSDSSRSGLEGLAAALKKKLRGRLAKARGIELSPQGAAFSVDAWIQGVKVKKVEGGNLVEVSCSAALSALPSGGVRFNTRATAGVGVEEAITKTLQRELALEALDACAKAMSEDIARFARQKAR